MLYLRAITLKDYGTKREPRAALRLDFGATQNKYGKTYPINVFEDSSLASTFAGLVKDFEIEEIDKMVAVDCDIKWEGDVFTADVSPHYVVGQDGKVVEENGEKVISTTLTAIWVRDLGITQESVIRSYERMWSKNGLLAPVKEEED